MDLIDRKAILEKAWDVPFDGKHIQVVDIGDILDAPSIQPERKTGKWEPIRGQRSVFKCNICGHFLDFDGVNAGRGSANFCPNCGAKMEG